MYSRGICVASKRTMLFFLHFLRTPPLFTLIFIDPPPPPPPHPPPSLPFSCLPPFFHLISPPTSSSRSIFRKTFHGTLTIRFLEFLKFLIIRVFSYLSLKNGILLFSLLFHLVNYHLPKRRKKYIIVTDLVTVDSIL